MKCFPRHIKGLCLLTFSALLTCGAFGQSIIKKLETKEFPQYEYRYPYEIAQEGSEFAYLQHKPSLRLSEFEFIYTWPPDNASERVRAIMKYDLLLEEIWRTDIKLDLGEDIVHIYQSDTTLIVLSTNYKRNQRQHSVYARKFGIQSGEELNQQVLMIIEGRYESEILFAHSPDSSKLLFYHYGNSRPNKRHFLSFDFTHNDETIGHRTFSSNEVGFKVFHSNTLSAVFEDTLEIASYKRSKGHNLGCQVDDDGNVYNNEFARPNTLRVTQVKAQDRDRAVLEYDNFPSVWRDGDVFGARFPGVPGKNGTLYYAISDREKISGRWHTLGFRILAFDFNNQEVNTNRYVKTDATMLVHASKNREAFGLKPARRFDNYFLREIIEMPNGHVWLFTQKLQLEHLNSYRTYIGSSRYGHRLEEIIMYEFYPNGEFRRAIVMPSVQEVNGPELQGGEFYSFQYDEEGNRFQFLTHEKDGEKLNRSPRTFYREVDLESGEVTQRKLVYKGRRETQLFFKSYTVWLSPTLIAMLQEDGYQDRTYLISIDLEGEPEEDKKKRRKRRDDDKPISRSK